MKLFNALDGQRPFRRFKDTLYELDLWDEWNKFERQKAEEEIQFWIDRYELPFDQLAELYKSNNPYL
ncbi:hypothetical protein [Ammoniphilus sp. 3BR4]|uniref:hypothetical protein n=1 Tax=Ammoniphilus sp. 3BR4 TaxID=3158265 RepID=UPI0034674FA6